MKPTLNLPSISMRFSYLLVVICIIVFSACDREEAEPLIACITYDKTITYTIGKEIFLSSCTQEAASYEWEIGDTILTGQSIQYTISSTFSDYIRLKVTDNNGNVAVKDAYIDIENVSAFVDHKFDFRLASGRTNVIQTKPNEIFVYGQNEDNLQFGAYFTDEPKLQSVKSSDKMWDAHHLNVISTGFMEVEDGYYDQNYSIRLLEIIKYNEWREYLGTETTMVPVDDGLPISVKDNDRYYVVSDSYDGSSTLSFIDQNGDHKAAYDLPSRISEETKLISFVQNMQSGYTLILEDSATGDLIRMDLSVSEDRVSTLSEYFLPLKASDLTDPVFLADGELLLIGSGENRYDTELMLIKGDGLKWSSPIDQRGISKIVPSKPGQYLIFGGDMTVAVAGLNSILHLFEYSPIECIGIISLNNGFYLVGNVDVAPSGESFGYLRFLKVGFDGLLLSE